MAEWDDEQLTAGFRSMMLLAALVERGGRPAAVSPTVRLSPGEKQYGWLPADVAGDGRRVVVITDQRILVGERQWSLGSLTEVRSEPADCAVTLRMRGRRAPVTLSGPWVPWLGVVLCAELYNAAFPPEKRILPGPRRPARSVDPDLRFQRQRVVVPHPVHRGDRHPGAAV
ncbi:hypothetical protein [Actinoplanes ianthinogenes]|uniref:hypothetical protein n=1 Tax=Actinoplanes ianthinogenes TaxID=122358 RepID=UPI00166FE63B|nr:hypothetical protein [Actinoplanes ianthinogenes]